MSFFGIVRSRSYKDFRVWTFVSDSAQAYATLVGIAFTVALAYSFMFLDLDWVYLATDYIWLAMRILFVIAIVIACIINKQSHSDEQRKRQK